MDSQIYLAILSGIFFLLLFTLCIASIFRVFAKNEKMIGIADRTMKASVAMAHVVIFFGFIELQYPTNPKSVHVATEFIK